MAILIIGGGGYIGSHTVRAAWEEGREIVVFDNFEEGHREALPPSIPLVEGDLRKKVDIELAFDEYSIEGVLHFAAYCSVGESVKNPQSYYKNNLQATFNLLEVMLNRGVKKFILSSTAATYGQPPVDIITEETKTNPINPYGRSKLWCEEILKDYRQAYGMDFISLRYFNAAGAHPRGGLGEKHHPETHLIPIVLEVARGSRKEIAIFGTDYPTPDGTCIRDYIHVSDLASAHLLAWDQLDNLGGEIFNLGSGQGFSVREVIDTCREVTGQEIPSREDSRRPGDPPRLVASCEKAREVLGWDPQWSNLKAIVETAWKWHQNMEFDHSHILP